MSTEFLDTGPPEGRATPLLAKGAEIGADKRTRHIRREIKRDPTDTQRDTAPLCLPRFRSTLGADLFRAQQLLTIANNPHASDDARQCASVDLWREFLQ